MARDGTKGDKSGHFAPVEVLPELSPEQQLALSALLEGVPDAVAAERAGVSRQTVVRWRLADERFAAALNASRLALWDESLDRLRAMLAGALTVVADDLASDDVEVRRAAARDILKAFGLSRVDLSDVGSVNPEKLHYAWLGERQVTTLDKLSFDFPL